MEFKGKVLGVETAFDGVVIIVQQERMEIPIAKELENTDEMLIAKKIRRSMKMIGIPVDVMECQARSGFKTPVWVTFEDYEEMGKPTIGDTLQFRVEKFQEPEMKIGKPITPVPHEKYVMFTMKKMQGKGLDPPPVERIKLKEELSKRFKLTAEEIEKAVTNLLKEGTLYEPKENFLKVT